MSLGFLFILNYLQVIFDNNYFRMYNAGLQPKIKNLYPPVSYPVSRGTPMIQSLIEWDHSIKWAVADFTQKVIFIN